MHLMKCLKSCFNCVFPIFRAPRALIVDTKTIIDPGCWIGFLMLYIYVKTEWIMFRFSSRHVRIPKSGWFAIMASSDWLSVTVLVQSEHGVWKRIMDNEIQEIDGNASFEEIANAVTEQVYLRFTKTFRSYIILWFNSTSGRLWCV